MIAYSLFSGAGGFDLGLEDAGIEVVVATDIDPVSASTYRRNWPQKPFLLKDARLVSGRDLLELAGGRTPDLVFGGPPCQGFSTLGDKLSSDPRNRLVGEFARIVSELNPRFVLIENVAAFVTMYHGQYRDYVVRMFSNLGFTMYFAILNAAEHGVPQVRRRSVFFGTRLAKPFSFPSITHGEKDGLLPYETSGKWIMDLAEAGPEISNHIPLNHSEKVRARYRLIPEGGRLPLPAFLPPEIRRGNFGSTYKRLNRDKPSLTLVPGNNAFPIHPTLDRSLTPREAARLQTFPDWFVFEGDRRRQCIQVGNAVPPLMARKLGESILSHEKDQAKDLVVPGTEQNILEYRDTVNRTERVLPIRRTPSRDDHGFIDLFSGAGGFTIGFTRAGWTPMLCVDLNKSVKQTHEYNLPSVPFLPADLATRDSLAQILASLGGQQVSLVVGGPPCQGFSVFGKRRFTNTRGYDPHVDQRNKLVYSYMEIVGTLKPRWFVMENVPGLASLDGGSFLNSLLCEFQALGYKDCEAKVLNAADYGVPQIRKRLVIIGNRTGHVIPWPKRKFFQNPADWQDAYRPVGEVISDLARDDSGISHTCHVPMHHKPLVVERFKYIPEGGRLDVDALPDNLRKGYRTESVKNYSHVFRRLHRSEPSITMVPGHNALPIHPWLDRALTVREAARIQTFPDEVEFKGSRQEQCIQVGNAFPPMLAELIALNILKAEVNNWYPGKVPASAYYSLVEKQASGRVSCSSSLQKALPGWGNPKNALRGKP